MKLEIRNLQAQTTFQVDAEGAVIGREGSQAADIKIKDQSISKRHARIFADGGEWFIEDLGSSNGTFVNNRRISEPAVLVPGSTFKLSENPFEVVQLLGGGGKNGAASSVEDPSPMWDSPGPSPKDERPGRTTRELDDDALGDFGRGANKRSDAPGPSSSNAYSADEVEEKKGIGAFFVAVPKGIAHYIVNVPLMALNPIGTIKKGIAEPKFGPLGLIEMVGYALPALLVSMALPSIVGGLMVLIRGGGIGTLISGIITPAIAAPIGAVVTGFIFHPVTKWIIEKLKGESDATSRSNYFVMSMTLTALVAVPNTLAVLIGLIPLPFVNLIPPLLQVVVTGVWLFFAWSWAKAFNLVEWVNKVLLVLGALAVLGTAYSLVMNVISTIRSFGSGSTPTIAGTTNGAPDPKTAEEIKKATEEATQKALEAAKSGNPAAAAEAQKAIEAAAKNAEAATKAAAEAAHVPAPKLPEPKVETKPDPKSPVVGKPDKGDKPLAEAHGEDSPKPEKVEKIEKAAPPPQPERVVDSASGDKPNLRFPSSPYRDYTQKRDALEKALLEDPFLLRKVAGLRDKYEAYHKQVYAITKKFAETKKKKSEPGLDRPTDRQRDLEIFDKTAPMVNELYEKIFR